MAPQRKATRPDALDRWITEVGEDYIAGLVEATRQGVAAGTIPTFRDKRSFLEYLKHDRTALDKLA